MDLHARQEFKYFAFISYSHRDMAIARRMHHDLESYKLPSAIQKHEGGSVPKKISPIFRDETDLSVGDLEKNLHEELEQSKYLIVICSPNSANPNEEGKNYVNGEVEHFCKIGRSDYIIPVIARGTPDEAFCPKLKELGKLALDANKMPRERIVNDIVAKILGLKPDELWRREARRRRRTAIVRLTLSLIFFALLALSSWYYCDWNREKVVYFKDYVERFAIPHGLFPLDRKDIGSRFQSYRFHFQGYDGFLPWRRKPVLRCVLCVNSQDKPREDDSGLPLHAKTAWQKFVYGENGRLVEIRHLRPNGYETAIFRMAGASDEFIDVTRRGHDGQWGTPEWGTGEIVKGIQSDKVRRIVVRRGADGFVRQVLYKKDSKGTPVSSRGVGKECYELDGFGRVVTKKTYACDGRRTVGDGAKGDEFRYSYSEEGDLDSVTVLQNGRIIEEVKCDSGVKNRPESLNKKYGEYGELVEERLFGKDDTLEYIVRYKYDATLSYRTETAFFDSSGNPTNNLGGWSKHTTKYQCEPGGEGTRRIARWFDAQYRPVNTEEGHAAEIADFDAKGRCVKVEMFGKDGENAIGKHGYHCAKFEYDRFGYRSRESYFGRDGKPVVANFDSVCYHSLHAENDESGNVLQALAYGVDGNSMNIRSRGYAKEVKRYDGKGRIIEISFFDADGNRVCPEGMTAGCRQVTAYDDDSGGKTIDSYLVEGSYIRVVLDGNGNRLYESYHNPDDSLRQDDYGVAKVQYKYDAKNREIKRGYFDALGQRTLIPEGLAGWENIYDECGDRIEKRYFGLDGKTSNDNQGIAIIRWRYDKAHHQVAKDYFDATGKPAHNNEGDYGERWEYDERGNQTASYSIDKDGKAKPDANGIGIVRYEYDAKGRIAKRRFFDVNDKPTKSNEGIGGWTSEYDDAGNETCRMFFDENEKPCMCGGRAGWRTTFDDWGREIESMNLDCNGNMAVQYLKIGGVEMKPGKVAFSYLRDGRRIATGEGFEGEAVFDNARKVRVLLTRDGDIERLECMDEDGNLVDNSLGYARKEIRYNEFREATSESFWNARGKPAIFLPTMTHKSTIVYERTNAGLLLDVRSYDTDGFPAVDETTGFARLVVRYDAQGRLLSQESFDEQNKPKVWGRCSKVFIEYDTEGKAKSILLQGGEDGVDAKKIKMVFSGNRVELSLLDGSDRTKETVERNIQDIPEEVLNLVRIRYSVDSNRRPTQIVLPSE